MTNSHQEAEIKLRLTRDIYEHLKKQYSVKNKVKNQANFFLDSSEKTLLHHKWVLRIRIEDGNRGFLTVKGPGEITGSLHIRPEYEECIPVEEAKILLKGFDLASLRLLPCIELVKRFGNHHVKPYLSFQNLRDSFDWKEWKFELDKTTIKDTVYYELEVETDLCKKDILDKELKKLFKTNAWDYIPSSMSKFRRALAVLNP